MLIFLSATWVGGILLGSFVSLPPFAFAASMLPLFGIVFAPRRRKLFILASACLLLLVGGALYYQVAPAVEGSGVGEWAWLEALRNALAESLAAALPEPQASLAQGILLGMRWNIPQPIQDEFLRTGTTHILAISGQNLSILAGILVSFGIWLFGRRHYIYVWMALGIIWFYAVLAGLQPPVLRAVIMASVFLAAELAGRQRSSFTALAFAAAVMVGFTPQALWEISFQMSFLAMAGLIFASPPIQAFARGVVKTVFGEEGWLASAANLVADSVAVTLGATLAVLPLIAYLFGTVSWVGPAATFFAVPAFPGIIVFGLLTSLAGLVALPLAQVIGWVAWLFLSYMLLVVNLFSGAPFTEGVRLGSAFFWAYYGALALVLWLNSRRDILSSLTNQLKSAGQWTFGSAAKLPARWAMPAFLVIALLVWAAALTMPDSKLRASFLDVGQGDAILFQKGSQQILVDGGPDGRTLSLALGREMPFWDRTIDMLILTHPHADHLTGLNEVLKRYRVNQVLYANVKTDSPLFAEWKRLLQENNVEQTFAVAGQQIHFGEEILIEVLNPQPEFLTGTESDIDNNGVVLRVEMGKVSLLVTGDIQREGEMELAAGRANLASSILKVAHHGSATSSAEGFLAAVRPYMAVIQVGANNQYGHPHEDAVRRLQAYVDEGNILRTDQRGRIMLITDGQKLWLRTER